MGYPTDELPRATRLPGTLVSAVHEALGEASMAWAQVPSGIFDATACLRIGDELCKAIEEHVEQLLNTRRDAKTALAEIRDTSLSRPLLFDGSEAAWHRQQLRRCIGTAQRALDGGEW